MRSHEFDVVDYSYKVVYAYIYILVYYGIIVVVRVTKRPLLFCISFLFLRATELGSLGVGGGGGVVCFPEEIVSPGWLSAVSVLARPPGLQRPDSFLTAAHFIHIYIRFGP